MFPPQNNNTIINYKKIIEHQHIDQRINLRRKCKELALEGKENLNIHIKRTQQT